MTRRLLAQFGLAALALALSGGIALADSAVPTDTTTPGNHLQQSGQSGSTVQSSGQDSIQISSSQSSNQQVGGLTGGSDVGTPPSGSGGLTLSVADPSATASTDGSGTHNSAGDSNAGPGQTPPPSGGSDSTPTTPSATTTGGAGGSALGAAPTPPGISAAALKVALHQAAARAAAESYPPVLKAIPTDVPQPPAPGAPHQPAGLFFGQIPLLMQQVVVPAARIAPPAIAGTSRHLNSYLLTPAALVAALILFGLTALVGRFRQSTASMYTARLRRSGFLGAARSDVGAAVLLFATPREMGCIGAYAT